VAWPSIAAAAAAAGFDANGLVPAVAVGSDANKLAAAVAVVLDASKLVAAAGSDEPGPAVQHYIAAAEPSDETKTAIGAPEESAHERLVPMPSIAGAAVADVPKERKCSEVYL
jgi:uncharacterized iron-regulated membrane protein